MFTSFPLLRNPTRSLAIDIFPTSGIEPIASMSGPASLATAAEDECNTYLNFNPFINPVYPFIFFRADESRTSV